MFVNVNCSSKFVLVESQFFRRRFDVLLSCFDPKMAVFRCFPISREFVRTCACVKCGRTYVCSYVRTEPRTFVKFCSHRRHLFIKYKFLWNICRRADPIRDTVTIFKKKGRSLREKIINDYCALDFNIEMLLTSAIGCCTVFCREFPIYAAISASQKTTK